MPATNVTDFFIEAKPLWVGKVAASGVASAVATTIPAQDAANLTNGNVYIVTANRTDSTGTTKHPANERETFIGKLSGTSFVDCVRQVEGVAQAWEADTVLEILVTATNWNKLIEGLEQEHTSGGKHKIDKLDAIRYAADAGASDAYAITLSPAPTAYYAGMVVVFKANTANTGACTLNVNALGAKDIKKYGSSGLADPATNDILASQVYVVVYDGTRFILVNVPIVLSGSAINDTNGNESIKIPATTSAVNEVTITNAATGGAPKVSATGDDANIDLELAAKGTGLVKSNTLYGDITNDTDGATITIDASVTNRRQVVLGGNRALAITNMKKGQIIVFEPIQDSTGSRLISSWPSWGATATMTIATPGVVTAGKDIPTGTPVIFTTTGALPTGVVAGTVYWWTRIDATTGKLSTSLANCQAGTYIATSGSQSGVHTMAVQVRWPSQTAPTLSTGKYLGDIINFYVKDAVNTVVEGMVAAQGI